LLLFLNPYGGKKNALSLYEKFAKPIFQLANVDVSVIITQRPNQIFDLVMQQHLDHFDGIVSAGGDGTFAELFNGLIYRDALKRGHSNESSKIEAENIPRLTMPLGIIPAGSTDTVAHCLHGTTDIKTCIIHIVLGQTTGLDLASASNEKGIVKFYASVISYGYFGDLLAESDKYRWLGPKRYEYSGMKKIFGNRGYNVELLLHQDETSSDMIPNSDPKKKMKCYEKCPVCTDIDLEARPSVTTGKFKSVTGKFFVVCSTNISCACGRSPSGISPYCHLGDGYMDLILIKHGNLFTNLKMLLTLASAKGNIADLPFVEVHRTKMFHIKALESSNEGSFSDSTPSIAVTPNDNISVWNCDGEVLQETELIIRSHRQLITVYRRGAAPENPNQSKTCCMP